MCRRLIGYWQRRLVSCMDADHVLFAWAFMCEFTEEGIDVSRHGEVEGVLGVVPFEVYTAEERGVPICSYLFMFYLEEVLRCNACALPM